MERIVIDDGSKTYEIVNQDGKHLGEFTINPSDANIVDRYNSVVNSMSEYFGSIDESEPVTTERFLEFQHEIQKRIDELVGEDTSKTFFSISGPLSPLKSGKLFAEEVLEAIGAIIEKETAKRVKKVQTRMDKYLQDYQPKA